MGFLYLTVPVAWAVFAGRSFAYPYSVDGDLFWQRRLGEAILRNHALPHALGWETFAAAGSPWVPQEWLLGIAVALAVSYRWLWLLALLAATAAIGALVIAGIRAAHAGANPFCNLLTFLAAFVAIGTSYGIRAQVFAWPLFSSLLYVLDYGDARALWAVPIVIAWANVHASVMLAVPIVWLDTALQLWRRGAGETRARIGIVLSVLVPLATLATPLGLRLPLFALTFARSPIRQYIVEWRPLDFSDPSVYAGALPLLAFAILGARRAWGDAPRDVVLSAALAFAMLFAMRNVPLFAICALPLAARGLTGLLQNVRLPADPMRDPGMRRLVAVAGPLLGAVIFFVVVRTPPPATSFHPPQRELATLAALPGEHRLYCSDFTDCSVALGFTNVRVFMDGRVDAYPLAVWDDFNIVRRTDAGWQQRLNYWNVDAVLVRTGDRLDRALSTQPDRWRFAAGDAYKRLYTRA